MANKAEVAKFIKNFCAMTQTQFNKTVNVFVVIMGLNLHPWETTLLNKVFYLKPHVLVPLNKMGEQNESIVIFLMWLVLFGFKLTYLLSFGGNVFLRLVILLIVLLRLFYKEKPHIISFLVTAPSIITLRPLDVSVLPPKFLVTEINLLHAVGNAYLLAILMERKGGDYMILIQKIILIVGMLCFMRIIFPTNILLLHRPLLILFILQFITWNL